MASGAGDSSGGVTHVPEDGRVSEGTEGHEEGVLGGCDSVSESQSEEWAKEGPRECRADAGMHPRRGQQTPRLPSPPPLTRSRWDVGCEGFFSGICNPLRGAPFVGSNSIALCQSLGSGASI